MAEWMMYDEHVVNKKPSSNALLDSDPTEATRHSSVFSHYVRVPHASQFVLEMTDTPWQDFPADAVASLDGADSALLLVSAADGVQSGTVSAYQHCKASGIPVLACLSKMDRPFVMTESVVSEIEDNLADGVKPVPLQVPVGEAEAFEGVKSLLTVDAKSGSVLKNPDVDSDPELQQAWTVLEEAVAMVDDELLVEYLEEGQLEPPKVIDGLRSAVLGGKILPLVYTSAERDLGVSQLMDAAVAVLPDPLDAREVALRAACESDKGRCGLVPGIEAGFSARVLHTNVDSFGSVSVLRVITNSKKSDDSGTFDALPHDAIVLRTGEKIKMPSSSTCFGLVGKERYPLGDSVASKGILPGDVLAVPKLSESVQTNDILVEPDAVKEDEAEIYIEAETNNLTPLSRSPEDVPLMASATVSLPESSQSSGGKKGKRGGKSGAGAGGDEKILAALRAMSREDLAIKVEHDPSGMLLLRCMSGDHLQIVAQRLKNRYGLEVELGRPPVQYRETLAKPVKNVEGKHKKQSGGSGQFGVCFVDVEPLEEGAGIEFVSRIKGGVISKPFISSVEKGVKEQLQAGGPHGYPVTDVRVTLVDGKMHSVDSKDIAFQSAGKIAVKAALEKGKTRLLQPMEKVIFTIDEQLQGEISAIVARGDGYLLQTDIASDGTHMEVEAVLPMSSIGDVSDILRAASGGEAQFTSEFSHYVPVPEDLVDNLLGVSD